MKVALVCIAKNEDNYINEWINYHLKIGFDDIFVYKNDWDFNICRQNVFEYQLNGRNKQIESYNLFINTYKNSYDYAAFFDVDEFLVLHKHKNIQELIKDYGDFNALAFNWVLFGNNGLEKVDNNNYSVLKRFTKRQKNVNQHVKILVNLSKNLVMDIHNCNLSAIDTRFNEFSGPFNPNGSIEIAQLNHYFCKTMPEYIEKISRGRANGTKNLPLDAFEAHNYNEIDDFSALNFYLKS